MKTKVAIIGCGSIADWKYLANLSQMDNVEVAAFQSRSRSSAEKACAKYGAPGAKVYDTAEELFKHPGLEAVHICTPNGTHASLTIAALEAGLHVMCEKPMAISAADAEEMVTTAKRCGKLLTIGNQGRFGLEQQYMKKLCASGQLGEIYFARAHAVRRRAVPTWGAFLDKEIQGGGCLIDIGNHALDLTLWLMDNYDVDYVVGNTYQKLAPTRDAANLWGPWDPDKFEVEDSAFAFIRMKNGATVELDCSFALNFPYSAEGKVTLAGTKGGLDTTDGLELNGELCGKLYNSRPDVTDKICSSMGSSNSANANRGQLEDWINAILTGCDPLVKPEQSLVICKITEAIYRSAETGKPVFFD